MPNARKGIDAAVILEEPLRIETIAAVICAMLAAPHHHHSDEPFPIAP